MSFKDRLRDLPTSQRDAARRSTLKEQVPLIQRETICAEIIQIGNERLLPILKTVNDVYLVGEGVITAYPSCVFGKEKCFWDLKWKTPLVLGKNQLDLELDKNYLVSVCGGDRNDPNNNELFPPVSMNNPDWEKWVEDTIVDLLNRNVCHVNTPMPGYNISHNTGYVFDSHDRP